MEAADNIPAAFITRHTCCPTALSSPVAGFVELIKPGGSSMCANSCGSAAPGRAGAPSGSVPASQSRLRAPPRHTHRRRYATHLPPSSRRLVSPVIQPASDALGQPPPLPCPVPTPSAARADKAARRGTNQARAAGPLLRAATAAPRRRIRTARSSPRPPPLRARRAPAPRRHRCSPPPDPLRPPLAGPLRSARGLRLAAVAGLERGTEERVERERCRRGGRESGGRVAAGT